MPQDFTRPAFGLADSPEEAMVDAIGLLKSDHRKVEDLFVQFEASESDSARSALAEQICNELKIHTMIEEELFYPALDGKVEQDMIDEAYVEHDGAKVLVNDIAAASAGDEFFAAKVKVLKEEVQHHVEEEEMPDSGIFAQARAAGVDLVALGARLKARKEALMAQALDKGLPPAEPRAVNLKPA